MNQNPFHTIQFLYNFIKITIVVKSKNKASARIDHGKKTLVFQTKQIIWFAAAPQYVAYNYCLLQLVDPD